LRLGVTQISFSLRLAAFSRCVTAAGFLRTACLLAIGGASFLAALTWFVTATGFLRTACLLAIGRASFLAALTWFVTATGFLRTARLLAIGGASLFAALTWLVATAHLLLPIVTLAAVCRGKTRDQKNKQYRNDFFETFFHVPVLSLNTIYCFHYPLIYILSKSLINKKLNFLLEKTTYIRYNINQ
jgi:hypothetical protein